MTAALIDEYDTGGIQRAPTPKSLAVGQACLAKGPMLRYK
jgi:hypothetical protein